MKRVLIAGAAIAALSVLATGPLAGAATSTTKLKCGIRLVVAIPPGLVAPSPTAASGDQFGIVNCAKPFGNGVQADSYTVTPSSSTTGKVSGKYREFFNRGSVHGTYTLSYTASGRTHIGYIGALTISGGTGRFRLAKGHGGLLCGSPDGGVHISCVAKLKLGRI